MDRAAMSKMRDDFAKKADTAWRNYQETGLTRFDTQRCRFEDLSEALTIALDAQEDHQLMVSLRAEMVELAYRAERAIHGDLKPEDVLSSLISYSCLVCGYKRRYS